jgi:mRNA interferase RelE/StbE
VSEDRFELVISPTARRQLTDKLPESVAFAAHEFMIGPLLDNPQRAGRGWDRHSPISTAPGVAPTG